MMERIAETVGPGMAEIRLYKSPWKIARIFMLSVPFVVGGVLMLSESDADLSQKIISWFVILFFGMGIPLGLFHLLDRRPQIIINENGIWDRTTNQGEIKWEQIKEAYVISIYRQKFISLVIDEHFDFKQKQYNWAANISKAIGAQTINLSLGQIRIDENKLTAFINEICGTEKTQRSVLIQKYFGS